jgi:MFS family permease
LGGTRLLALFCVAEVGVMAGFATFPALLPTFFAEWQLSNTDAGWINGIFFGAYLLAVPVLVTLTDRVDPRRIYLVAAVFTALSSLGFAFFAEGFWTALALRALAGIGLAGTYMPGLKALTDHMEDRLQSRAVAFYTSHFSIGTSLSFVLAGEVSDWLDWHWAFGLAALGPMIAFVLVYLWAPRSESHHIAHSGGFLLDFRPVLRNRPAMAYILAYCAHNWELFALRSWIVVFLVFSQSQQAEGALGVAWSATWLVAAMNLLGLPASVLGNEAARRFGRRRVVCVIMLISAGVACVLGFSASLPFLLVLLLCVVYGVTVPGESASLTAGAVAVAGPGQRGATMAMHSSIGFAGAFAGPLAFGVILDVAGGGESLPAWGLAFASSGLAVALGPLAILWLIRGKPTAGAPPT